MPLIVRGLAHSDYMVGAFQGEDNLRTSLTKMVVVMVEVTSDHTCKKRVIVVINFFGFSAKF